MANYIYEPLPNDGKGTYIRLVRLTPTPDSEEIVCSLEPHLLLQCPKFEALSYCWGDELDSAQILCDGKLIRVPANLRAFLSRVRAEGKEKTLWVDSMCINQGDNKERSSQVSAMRRIYSRATRVLVWLGEDYDGGSTGLEHASTLYQAFCDARVNPQATKPLSRFYSQLLAVFDGKWKAFFDLLDRPYFGRAWIVQELVLAREITVMCGPKSVPWAHLAGAVLHALTNEVWIFEFYGTSKNGTTIFAILMSSNEHSEGRWTPKAYWEILSRYRLQHASDPRDKVFAFYGFSAFESFKALNITPDYNLTVQELYTNLAAATLRSVSDLDFLSIPQLRKRDDRIKIPSWAPDWSSGDGNYSSLLSLEYGGHTKILGKPTHPYCATKDSKCTPIIDEENVRLQLLGYSVDKIQCVSRAWVLQDTSGPQSIRSQALVLQKNQEFVHEFETVFGLSQGHNYPTGEDMWEVFWQVAVAGIHPQGKEETRKAWILFERRQRYFRLLRKLHLHQFLFTWCLFVIIGHILRLFGIQNPEMGFRKLTSCVVNRKGVQTERGYIGLVSCTAEAGDEIVLFKGGKLPFTVRPRGSQWELVGDCYIHGLTNGEAWEESRCVSFSLE